MEYTVKEVKQDMRLRAQIPKWYNQLLLRLKKEKNGDERREKEREKSFRIIPSEFRKNSGRKKNSGMSSFTSVVDSELDSRHVVCRE